MWRTWGKNERKSYQWVEGIFMLSKIPVFPSVCSTEANSKDQPPEKWWMVVADLSDMWEPWLLSVWCERWEGKSISEPSLLSSAHPNLAYGMQKPQAPKLDVPVSSWRHQRVLSSSGELQNFRSGELGHSKEWGAPCMAHGEGNLATWQVADGSVLIS